MTEEHDAAAELRGLPEDGAYLGDTGALTTAGSAYVFAIGEEKWRKRTGIEPAVPPLARSRRYAAQRSSGPLASGTSRGRRS